MSVKPTYEELERYVRQADITIENLELKLAGSQREFRAADATIENLQMKLEKMAAENVGLKAVALDEIEVINRGGQAYCVKDGMSVNPIYARGWNDCRAKSLSVGTPATDAFLAEVRARAIDSLVDIKTKQLADMHPDTHAFGATAMSIRSQINELQVFAAQLRKGVQS